MLFRIFEPIITNANARRSSEGTNLGDSHATPGICQQVVQDKPERKCRLSGAFSRPVPSWSLRTRLYQIIRRTELLKLPERFGILYAVSGVSAPVEPKSTLRSLVV